MFQLEVKIEGKLKGSIFCCKYNQDTNISMVRVPLTMSGYFNRCFTETLTQNTDVKYVWQITWYQLRQFLVL